MFTICKFLDMDPAARIHHIWKGDGYVISGVIDAHLVFLLLRTQVGSHTLHCKLSIRKGVENVQKHRQCGQNDSCVLSVVIHCSSVKQDGGKVNSKIGLLVITIISSFNSATKNSHQCLDPSAFSPQQTLKPSAIKQQFVFWKEVGICIFSFLTSASRIGLNDSNNKFSFLNIL